MLRSFNTTGPCNPRKHYMLPPRARLGRVLDLIDREKYFVLRAGRQTGKTTSAQWLVEHFNAGPRYRALWIDLQTAGGGPDIKGAFTTILGKIADAVESQLPELPLPDAAALLADPRSALLRALRHLTTACPLPLVVFMDEADSLIGETMVLFLRQLRDGYVGRDRLPFPHSLVLIGMRDVRDYMMTQAEWQAVGWLGTASPFNVTAEVATLAPFTQAEVLALLGQHTSDTGQRFADQAADLIFELSCGHPWLVNALADWCVGRQRDLAVAITPADVAAAKEALIIERRTHIDSLIARLREPRVRRIIEPMLIGGKAADSDTLSDDFAYVLGLGLVAKRGGEYVVANPIYKEVIPRVLSHDQQLQIHLKPGKYLHPDGRLNLSLLMQDWQKFWRQDGHLAAEGFAYREAGPHLMLMAFLQRIINGGGRIDREYALGRGAVDLMVTVAGERHAIEIKIRRHSQTGAEALEQIIGYLDEAGLSEGWLVFFDPRKGLSWEERLTSDVVEAEGKRIHVIGC